MAIMVKGRIKKWGNSFGVIIPKEVIENCGYKENEEIEFYVVKPNVNVLRETFGTLKKKGNKTTEQLMREIDRELYPKDYE